MRDYVADAGRSCFVISARGRLASQSAENYQRSASDRYCVAEACPIENTLTPTNHTARSRAPADCDVITHGKSWRWETKQQHRRHAIPRLTLSLSLLSRYGPVALAGSVNKKLRYRSDSARRRSIVTPFMIIQGQRFLVSVNQSTINTSLLASIQHKIIGEYVANGPVDRRQTMLSVNVNLLKLLRHLMWNKYQSKVCVLCVNNTNLHPICHCFQVTMDYWSIFAFDGRGTSL